MPAVALQRRLFVESADGTGQAISPDEPHGVEGAAIAIGPESVHRHDPRVLQPAGNLRLNHEPRSAGRVVGVVIKDLLECHLAVQLGIQGDEHLAQPAARVRPEDAEPLALRSGRAGGVGCRPFGVAVLG
jgi:hypothetical protein